MKEIWKPIPRFQNYEASSYGNIRHKNRKKIRKTFPNWAGYIRVGFYNSNTRCKMFSVHRLVLESFVGPPPTGFEADHIDKNRSNNRISNLRWLSPHENKLNRSVRRGEDNNKFKVTKKMEIEIRQEQRLDLPLGHPDRPIGKDVGFKYGVHKETIYRIWRREQRFT